MKIRVLLLAALVTTTGCAGIGERTGDEGALPEGVEDCLRLNSVDHIEIVNPQRILFYMRDRTIYENRLSRRCPGLRRNDTIMYRTTLNRLCDIDTFTVLESTVAGFMPGPTCSLGKFYPITREEAEELKEASRRR